MQRLLIQHYVVAAVVGDEVLDHRHGALALDAGDLAGAGLPGQHRVLTEGVEGPGPGRVAVDVDERLEHHVHAQRPRVPADHHAVFVGVPLAERGRHTHGAGHPDRRLAGRDSRRTVRQPQ